MWQSEDGLESVCVGSIEELQKLTGQKVDDLHRETVDKLTIPSARPGMPPLKRIAQVFDCWFESGSMPYAQWHYPFENKKEFEESFPADFIAEGTDQTRGWFYTLLVLSTALFNKPAFKNLIVNGLVLASDGQKMSKRKKNYPDPNEVINKYGADALRLFLINSPVVKAESLRFKEEGVRDILKDVFLPWYNAYRFLLQNIESYQMREGGEEYTWSEDRCLGKSDNVMDKWIVSFTQSLLEFVKGEMAAYRLYTVLPRLMKFIDNLTNWYVRMNRKRLKGEGNSSKDCRAALDTLFSVLFTMVRVFAPFTPFLTETMYQRLKTMVVGYAGDKEKASVHFLMIPQPRDDLINENIERSVARMQAVIDLGRVIRDRRTIPVKYPLPEVVVIHKDQQCLDDVGRLQDYVLDELNVKIVTLSSDKKTYGVVLKAEPNFKALGARLKGELKPVMAEIKQLDDTKLQQFLKDGKIEVRGHTLGEDDLAVKYAFSGKTEKYETGNEGDVLVLLDCTPDQSMLDEGVSREVINRVQRLRKKANLVPTDEVTVYYEVKPATHDLCRVIEAYREPIESTTKSPIRPAKSRSGGSGKEIAKDSCDLKGAKMELTITEGFCSGFTSMFGEKSSAAVAAPSSAPSKLQDHGKPATKFVNVIYEGRAGVVLLENPVGRNQLQTCGDLLAQTCDLFNQRDLEIFDDGKLLKPSAKCSDLRGTTIVARRKEDSSPAKAQSLQGSSCKFVTAVDAKGTKGTVLLENPAGSDLSRYAASSVRAVFGSKDGFAFMGKNKKAKVETLKNGDTVFV